MRKLFYYKILWFDSLADYYWNKSNLSYWSSAVFSSEFDTETN